MSKQLIDDAPRKNVFMVDPDRLLIVGIDIGDEQHKLYDPRVKLPLDLGMIESIKAVGVRETVEVIVDDDGIYVIDGRRRVLHAREANKHLKVLGEPIRLVPVLGQKSSEASMHLAPLLGEHLNNHRVNDSAMCKAEKASRLIARGYSLEDVALAMNVDLITVKSYEKLLSLSAAVRKAVDEGKISPSAAVKLADMSTEEQKAKLEGLVGASPAGKRVTNKQVAAANGKAVAPGKKVLKKIVASDSEDLSEDFVRGVRFAMGDLSAASIKGLSAIIHGGG